MGDKGGLVTTTPAGSVVFIGVGPGDPELLTLRAATQLREAEVIVLDRPVDDPTRALLLAQHGGPEVELIDAAFGENGRPLTHAGRGKLITKAAKKGARVARLLDGDGASFVGLAEEMLACHKAEVAFEVVPGVSSATAVPTFAGVPVSSNAVRAVHVVDGSTKPDLASLLDPKSSVIVLGCRSEIANLASAVVNAGRDPHTTVLVIARGTTTNQHTGETSLQALADEAALIDDMPGETGTMVAIFGPTVELREKLSWFETKPLFGWRVLVPRTQQQAGPLIERLSGFGAVAELVPTISVEPPRTPHQMDKAVTGLVTGRYEWIGFTSVNAVRAVREKFDEYGLDVRSFAGLKVAAVGGVTAQALRDWGINADLVPSGEQSAKGLLEDWPAYDQVLDPINRVFLPRADIATDTLVAGLQSMGWEVDDVTAYRTVRAAPPPAPVRDAIKSGQFDAVLFTSSSTVRNLVGIAGKPHASTVIACIGPATAKTAQEHGLRVDVMAPEASAIALADSLADFGLGLRESAREAGRLVLRPSQKQPSGRRRAR